MSIETLRRLGDVKAAAQYLDIGVKSVRRMIDAGKIPGVCRLGRLVRIDLHVLDQWVAQGCPPLSRFDRAGGK